MKVEQSRFAYLDALRGFAALAVIYFHSGHGALITGRLGYAWERHVFAATSYTVDLGKLAVILFFAISGFVIPFSLDKTRNKPVESFVIGRLFRLYPAYWLSIGGAILVNYWMVSVDFTPITLLANLTMLQGFVGQPSMQGLFWTLQIELIFYGLCVLLFLFADLKSPKVAAGVAIAMLMCALGAAAIRFATGKALPVAIPLALFVMFIGLLWRLATIGAAGGKANSGARRAIMILLPVFVLLMPLIALLAYDDGMVRYSLTYFLAIGIFMLFTTRLKLQGRVFSFLGLISYSVYLFGSLIQKAFEFFLADAWQAAGIPLHLGIAAVMAVTIALATLVYRYVEAPSVKLGKRIIRYRLQGAPKPADAVAL